ncbi:MAG: response regulator transcription factor [Chloroflexi bacterium]|nr:response regulator transcription factor [Chloroflexota bacterium]
MKPERSILVVDDEPRLVQAMRRYLEMEGYTVHATGDGEEALEKVRTLVPDLIVLDVMMPSLDGFETLRRLRKSSTVPVIMLTVRGDEADRIRGLQLGADDYVTKPFSQRELLSRIQAVLRRADLPPPAPKTAIVVDDDLTIDFARHRVIARGQQVQLRPTEYRLQYHLVSNAGRVITHEAILAKVWGEEYRDEAHYVRLYITYLRQKIEPDPAHPKYILTERGIGYRFVDFQSTKAELEPLGEEAE